VEVHYVEEPVSDYLQAVVNTVLLIHEKVCFMLSCNKVLPCYYTS
jgi:hypothetical protein